MGTAESVHEQRNVWASWFQVQGLGFIGFWGLGFRVSGFRVQLGLATTRNRFWQFGVYGVGVPVSPMPLNQGIHSLLITSCPFQLSNLRSSLRYSPKP